MKMNNKGFTLVEVVVVVAILALIGVLVMPNILNSLDTGKKSSDRVLYGDIKEAMQVMYEEKAYTAGNIYYYDNNGKDETKKIEISSNSITTNIQTLISNGFLTGVNNDDLSVNKNKRIVVNSEKKDLGSCEVKITKTMKGSKVCYKVEGSGEGACPSTEDFGGNAQCGETQGTSTVTFYNGSNSIGTQEINNSTKTTLTSWSSLGGSVLSGYDGWSFAGWTTNSSGNTVKYKNSQDISLSSDTDLYAVYSRVLTINYNANGGSGNIDATAKNIYINSNSTITSSQEIILKNNFFIYDGYAFDKWTIDSNDYLVDESYDPNIQYNALNFGVNVYAKWIPNTYIVKYNGNGSTSGSMVDSDYVYGVAKNLSTNTFSKTGYYFSGWATSSDGNVVYSNNQSVKNLTTTNGATVNLYAKWSLNKYTIKYNGNGNTGGSMSTSTHSYGIAKNLTNNGFTKTGYHFIGWATSSDGDVIYNDGQSVTNLLTNNGGTVNLYAKWEPNSYILRYNANGGTGSMSDTTITYGTEVKTRENAFVNTGYTFVGWNSYRSSVDKWLYVLADGSTGWYTKGQEPAGATLREYSNGYTTNGKATSVDGDVVTLYAQWKTNSYILRYNANGGTGSMSDTTITYGIEVKTRENTFVKNGYTFVGWNSYRASVDKWLYVLADGSTEWYPKGQEPAGATLREYSNGYTTNGKATTIDGDVITLYAKWTPATFAITLDKKGGSNGTNGPIYLKYDTGWYSNSTATTEITTITPPTKTGYTFKGYYYTNTSDNEFQVIDSTGKIVVSNYTFSGDRTIYAIWEANTYKVTYNVNGGTGTMTQSSHTYDIAKKLTTSAFTRTGYTFEGWATSETGNVKYTDGQSVTNLTSTNGGIVNLYAKWTPSTFTITLDKKGGSNGTNGPIYLKYDTGWYSNNTATTEITLITPPTMTGYTFKGYYYTNTSDNEFQVIDSSGKIVSTNNTFSGDRTIYAKWDKITYTISYNANGGTGAPSSQTKTYGVSLTLSSTKPTREGYKFLGWSTSSTATTATYNAGSVYSSNASATLYAVWELIDLVSIMEKEAVSDENIDFCKTSESSNTNGIYYIEETINDTNPIYYYRGKVDNNLIFADTCWKIVRTTETGGLKLIYNGVPTNGTCDNMGENSSIGQNWFNSNFNSLTSVGYMYSDLNYSSFSRYMRSSNFIDKIYYYSNDVKYSNGSYTLSGDTISGSWNDIYDGKLKDYHYSCLSTGTTCTNVNYIFSDNYNFVSYITLAGGKKVEDALVEMLDYNIVSSTIKGNKSTEGTLDYWYYNNIQLKGYNNYMEDSVWCYDRSIYNLNGWNPNGGEVTLRNGDSHSWLEFNAKNRVQNICSPTLICSRAVDRFTVDSSNGNGMLDYPVGLLTADEVLLAGGASGSSNSSYYLYTGSSYLLGTPAYYGYINTLASHMFYIRSDDSGYSGYLTSGGGENGVRPVVSLAPGFTIIDGDGTTSTPYIVG